MAVARQLLVRPSIRRSGDSVGVGALDNHLGGILTATSESQLLTIAGKRGNSVKFTGERQLFTGEERAGAGEVHQ